MMRFYKKNKVIFHNFIWRGLQIASKQGTLFIFTLIAAKLLSVDDFGKFTYYFTTILLLTMLSDFGLSSAISKYTAEYNYKDKQKINSLTTSSLVLLAAISIIIIVFSGLIGSYFLEDSQLMYILLPLVFLVPATSVFDGIFRGLENFKTLTKISSLTTILSILPFYWSIKSFGVSGLAWAYLIFYFLLLCLTVIFYAHINGKKFGEFNFNVYITRQVLNYSYYLGLAALSYFMFSRFTIILMGHFGFIEQVAYYELISRFEAIFLLPFFIAGHVFAPKITALYAKEKPGKFYKVLKKTRNYTLLSSITSAIIFLGIVLIVIQFYFGNYDTPSFRIILLIESFLFIIKSYSVVIDFGFVISTGYGHLMAYRYLIIAVINIALSLLLNNYLGYLGIIISMFFCHILMTLSLHLKFFNLIKYQSKVQKHKLS